MSSDQDRNTFSISPSLSYFPPQGSDFKDKVYKTDDSNNLDAGVSPQHCQNVPDSGGGASSTPASAVNSLNKFMHPQPHPPIMHHPDLVSMMGRTRAPFSPPPANFTPPLVSEVLPPSVVKPGSALLLNDSGERPGCSFVTTPTFPLGRFPPQPGYSQHS